MAVKIHNAFIIFYRIKLEEMKTMQKLRDRPNGVNIVTLALGEKLSQEEEKLMVSKLILPYSGVEKL